MERLFLCCFRSCLKGDNDREYYDILEITDSNRATTDQVKKQYKKLSLSLHPDKLAQKGIEVTPEHKQRFVKLKEAYDVLSDPKRRRLYDEYGLSGLKLMENPTELDSMALLRNFQKNRGDRTSLGLFIAFIFAIILILPILFSLKCDGTLKHDAKWVAIWTPMWVVDVILLFSSIYILFDQGSKKAGQFEENEDGEKKEENDDKVPLSEKILNLGTTIAFVLIQIFITMKLDGYIDSWSWFEVFIPWFLYEGMMIVAAIPTAYITAIPKPSGLSRTDGANEPEEESFMSKLQEESEYFEKLLEQDNQRRYILIYLLRVWLAVFIALEVDGLVDWNWGLVLLPIWLYFFLHYIYSLSYRAWAQKQVQDVPIKDIEAGVVNDPILLMKAQQANVLQSTSSAFCFNQIFLVFMAIMLVCRLEAGSYSTFLIILPVFIGIGCCCCAVFCGLIGMSMVDMESLEEEINAQRGGAPSSGASAGAEGADVEAGYAPPASDVNSNKNDETSHTHIILSPKEESDAQQSPLLAETNKEPEKSTKLIQETTIDPDID